MRISSATIFNNAVTAMNQEDALIAQTQQQISSGKQLNSPADNPTAASIAVNINQQITQIDDFAQSRTGLETNLAQMGTVMSQVTTTLQSVLQDLVSASSGAKSSSDLKALATDLQSNFTALQTYANTQDANGNYIFSGYQVGTQPFAMGNYISATSGPNTTASLSLNAPMASALPSTGTLTYQNGGITADGFPAGANVSASLGTPVTSSGVTTTPLTLMVNGQSVAMTVTGALSNGDSFTLAPQASQYLGDYGTRALQVSNGQMLGSTLAGPNVFGSIATGNGTFTTAAYASNTGSGIVSQGSITNQAALVNDPYLITFSGGEGALAASSGNTGTAALVQNSMTGTSTNSDPYQIVFNVSGGQTSYTVTDQTTGLVPSGYSNVAFTPSSATSIALPNGQSFSLTGAPNSGDSFNFTSGAASQYSVVDQTTGTTVLSNQSFGSGNAIQFNGMSLVISGAPENGDQFSVTPSGTTDVFSVIQNAINALNQAGTGASAAAALSNTLGLAQSSINGAIAQVDTQQAVIGGRQNLLSALDSSTAQNKINLQSQLGTLTDTDYASAISTLQQQLLALQASQKAFAQIEGLSLFNYIQ